MGVEKLIAALVQIDIPSSVLPMEGIPGEFRGAEVCKEFFSQSWVQDRMLEINKENIHERQENVYGQHVGVYSERNAKRKGLHYYNYYETGDTSDSLMVMADERGVDIVFDETMPEYAPLLDKTAWGVPLEAMDEFEQDLTGLLQEKLKQHLDKYDTH